MKDRWGLIQKGLFPETLPPAYTSVDLKRAFGGLIKDLTPKQFHKRSTDYIRYSGTKHDHSRRFFGTPNPISYFFVADFIADHCAEFQARFEATPFSVSGPKIAASTDDRPIIIPSLSQLTTIASKQIGYSPVLLRTDIAQFFPSVYTHSLPWSAHGIANSKADTLASSKKNYFNQLDFFVRSCQLSETWGLMVGPDAFRLIAEFIACGLDGDLRTAVGNHIIGAARHVDDYYIGLKTEPEALAVLSKLREILQRYGLNINDTKTKISNGLEPLNEFWAQSLRHKASELPWDPSEDRVVLMLTEGVHLSKQLSSDSPLKIILRALDKIKLYQFDSWVAGEPYLQRIMFHHPHCIDYIALLVAKRYAITGKIDNDGWKAAIHNLLKQHLALNNHHEIVWLIWLLLSCKIELAQELVNELCGNQNAHIRALLIAGFVQGRVNKAPPLKLGNKLGTTDDQWLTYLVACGTGFSKASFSGDLSTEFEHLARKNVVLIDFKHHMEAVAKKGARAISRSRYGYDNDDDENENPFPDLSHLEDIEF